MGPALLEGRLRGAFAHGRAAHVQRRHREVGAPVDDHRVEVGVDPRERLARAGQGRHREPLECRDVGALGPEHRSPGPRTQLLTGGIGLDRADEGPCRRGVIEDPSSPAGVAEVMDEEVIELPRRPVVPDGDQLPQPIQVDTGDAPLGVGRQPDGALVPATIRSVDGDERRPIDIAGRGNLARSGRRGRGDVDPLTDTVQRRRPGCDPVHHRDRLVALGAGGGDGGGRHGRDGDGDAHGQGDRGATPGDPHGAGGQPRRMWSQSASIVMRRAVAEAIAGMGECHLGISRRAVADGWVGVGVDLREQAARAPGSHRG